MKGPYPKGKGKGKVHPSPGPSANSSSGDVPSALKLLPADILAQTAALGEKDKEVLAYLITTSLKCHVAPRAAASHRPMIGCGCFECYKSFWSRWNDSPDKGIIDQAIDAFEEHLARVEKEKEKEKEKADNKADKDGKKKSKRGGKVVVVEKVPEQLEEPDEKAPEEAEVSSESKESETVTEEETEKVLEEEGSEDNGNGEAAVGGGGEKRKSWVDLMGIFNFRFFGA